MFFVWCSGNYHSSSLFSPVLKITTASAGLGQCFQSSGFLGNTPLDLKNHLAKDHRVILSQVIDSESSTECPLRRASASERDIPWSPSEARYEPNSEDLVPKQKTRFRSCATTEQPNSANEGAIKTHGDCTRWRLCWVQVDEHVMPVALYQLEGYCLTSPAPLRAEVPATASVFPVVETAKEIDTGVEQLQQCNTSTVESKVSLTRFVRDATQV